MATLLCPKCKQQKSGNEFPKASRPLCISCFTNELCPWFDEEFVNDAHAAPPGMKLYGAPATGLSETVPQPKGVATATPLEQTTPAPFISTVGNHEEGGDELIDSHHGIMIPGTFHAREFRPNLPTRFAAFTTPTRTAELNAPEHAAVGISQQRQPTLPGGTSTNDHDNSAADVQQLHHYTKNCTLWNENRWEKHHKHKKYGKHGFYIAKKKVFYQNQIVWAIAVGISVTSIKARIKNLHGKHPGYWDVMVVEGPAEKLEEFEMMVKFSFRGYTADEYDGGESYILPDEASADAVAGDVVSWAGVYFGGTPVKIPDCAMVPTGDIMSAENVYCHKEYDKWYQSIYSGVDTISFEERCDQLLAFQIANGGAVGNGKYPSGKFMSNELSRYRRGLLSHGRISMYSTYFGIVEFSSKFSSQFGPQEMEEEFIEEEIPPCTCNKMKTLKTSGRTVSLTFCACCDSGYEPNQDALDGYPCICGELHADSPTRFGVQCETCNDWYTVETQCVQMTEGDAKEEDRKWKCMKCDPELCLPDITFDDDTGAVAMPAADKSNETDNVGEHAHATTKGRKRKKCSHKGCSTGSRRGGLCTRHGATRKKCSHEGCSTESRRGGLCTRHGATRKECSHEGCSTQSKRGGLCFRHGARKECSHEGCSNQSQRGGLCSRHGGARKECSHEGCSIQSRKGGLCFRHGAKKKECSHEGCSTPSQRGGLCFRHGAKKKE